MCKLLNFLGFAASWPGKYFVLFHCISVIVICKTKIAKDTIECIIYLKFFVPNV